MNTPESCLKAQEHIHEAMGMVSVCIALLSSLDDKAIEPVVKELLYAKMILSRARPPLIIHAASLVEPWK